MKHKIKYCYIAIFHQQAALHIHFEIKLPLEIKMLSLEDKSKHGRLIRNIRKEIFYSIWFKVGPYSSSQQQARLEKINNLINN